MPAFMPHRREPTLAQTRAIVSEQAFDSRNVGLATSSVSTGSGLSVIKRMGFRRASVRFIKRCFFNTHSKKEMT